MRAESLSAQRKSLADTRHALLHPSQSEEVIKNQTTSKEGWRDQKKNVDGLGARDRFWAASPAKKIPFFPIFPVCFIFSCLFDVLSLFV